MQLNIKQLDQTHWVCYQFDNNKYYYGQVAYLDQNGNIHPKDSTQMASNTHARLVKHGVGVFIYGVKNGVTLKYEGYWQKDRKSGYGKMVYQNNNIYKGNWRQDLKSQNGKYIWSNGNSYEGNWKRDRFDGVGIFKHRDGFELKGSFRCNNYIDGQNLRNPFMNNEQYERFKKAKKDILKQKQKINKQKVSFIERVNQKNMDQILKLINKSNNNNRIPLIFSSTKTSFSIKQFHKLQKVNQFDLRHIYLLKLEDRPLYYKQIRSKLVQTLKNGQIFIINLDDSNDKYQQLFYPDIRQFYDPHNFPPQIWSKQELSKKQIYQPLLQSQQINQVSKDFKLSIWTKYKINQQLDNKKIIQKIQKRFQSVLPIIKIDFIFLTQ